MNRDTRLIAALLKIELSVALRVQDQMAADGLDFSECTKSKFNRAAREAYKKVGD